jgi:hypothetical protein
MDKPNPSADEDDRNSGLALRAAFTVQSREVDLLGPSDALWGVEIKLSKSRLLLRPILELTGVGGSTPTSSTWTPHFAKKNITGGHLKPPLLTIFSVVIANLY